MVNAVEVQKFSSRCEDAMSSESIVEMPVLLETWLLKSLEEAANEQGLTTAEMVRRLIRDFVYYSDGDLKTP